MSVRTTDLNGAGNGLGNQSIVIEMRSQDSRYSGFTVVKSDVLLMQLALLAYRPPHQNLVQCDQSLSGQV